MKIVVGIWIQCHVSPECPFHLWFDCSAEVFCDNRIIYFQNTAEQRGGRFRLDKLDTVYGQCLCVCVCVCISMHAACVHVHAYHIVEYKWIIMHYVIHIYKCTQSAHTYLSNCIFADFFKRVKCVILQQDNNISLTWSVQFFMQKVMHITHIC